MTPPAAASADKRNPTDPKDLRRFYIKKGRLAVLLNGVQMMQKREDISGKFARKLTQVCRVLRMTVESVMEEEKALQELHKDKFPEGHAEAGKVKPVYATDNDGNPLFKMDASGNKTDEREIIPGQFSFADPVAYQTDRLEMLKEFVVVDIPCFRTTPDNKEDDKFVPELDRFGKVSGVAFDACAEFEEGSPALEPPGDIVECETCHQLHVENVKRDTEPKPSLRLEPKDAPAAVVEDGAGAP